MALKRLLICFMLFLLLSSFYTQAQYTDDDPDDDIDDGGDGKIVHKPLFPLTYKEIVATFLLALLVMITNAAGIGGGGAILPIMMLYNFDANVAVAL